ncbi:MAG: 4-(cytidine 5'-diphospho)-2-C-methyl-D-erythritol kinase [Planctomycetes bacterium]|nr:4-(cytidine 5'-diphospho)-2-C-methyl-D-erythritol kinase [Planctomycetota bacterium]MCB9905815.1 4-(cytidine 5'-diphospho)-2-C-methyl-D-erythritol kinase [Planctomycetota bacterium]
MTTWRRAVAPAKLNLRLEVLGKRPDGFHELDTDLITIDLADELRARATGGDELRFTLGGPALTTDVPADERNLAFRAARLVQHEARARGASRVGLELELTKQVPSRAGLGGASSDAVAALVLADAVLDARLGGAWLGERAAELGSDCRFFFDAHSGRARCTGRGEVVRPLDAPPSDWWIALVTPDVACPTPLVFGALRFPLPALPESAPLGAGWTAERPAPRAGNHLQEAAFRVCPDFAPWSALLAAQSGAGWQLTGSGSSVFALFCARDDARAALETLCKDARDRGLKSRFESVVRPAGHGVRLAD